MRAVLLAGGKGARLQPFTATFPKPLMPLDDMPVIELLVQQLHYFGVTELTVVTGHLAELIKAFLGDGSRWGVKIDYLKEETPLDTAGCLGLLSLGREPLLVMNGDLLTTLNFASLAAFHRKHKPIATISTYRRDVKIDLGVIKSDDEGRLVDYIEKPTYDFAVSMGVYCFDPRVKDYVGENERLSMPALMLRLRDAGEQVLCYREDCYWLDIGRPDDYARAIEDFRTDRTRYLPVSRKAA
jgi:NDP-sugar pyrophosphorylase family protein